MSFTLRVVFEGVLGWVPSEPFFKKTNRGWKPGSPKQLVVLLPDLREPRAADWEASYSGPRPDPRYRASHLPVLLVDPLDLRSADQFSPRTYFQDPRTGHLRALYLLAGASVQLPRLGKLSFENAVPSKKKPPKKDGPKRRSLWWLPRLQEISPAAQFADQELLTAVPEQFSELGLASRIEAQGGHLSTIDFNYNGEVTWSFASVERNPKTQKLKLGKEKRWRQAIGNRFSLEGEVESLASIVVKAEMGIVRTLVLSPSNPARKTIEITIANVEPEVLFLGEGTPWGPNDLPDPDFEPFFRMSSAPATMPLVPIGHSGTAGNEDKPCASGGYSGSLSKTGAKK